MPCCSERPRRYLNTEVAQIADLAPLLDREGTGETPREYRCRVCGQKWLQSWVPVMHSDIQVVHKEGACPDPFFDEDGRDPRTWAPPTPRAPAETRVKGDLPFLACAAFGVLTMAAIDTPWRGLWFLGWAGAGFVVAEILSFKRAKKPQ